MEFLSLGNMSSTGSTSDPTPTPVTPDYGIQTLNRRSFPPGFAFGFGSSYYQEMYEALTYRMSRIYGPVITEGAWNVDGKGPSEWDNFTHTYPEKVADHSNGDNGTKSFFLYKEDVQLLNEINADAYRFSISWSRILPNGRANGNERINKKGIEYYNNLIDHVIDKGLKPCVTMYHFDLPQALQDEYDGLLNQTKFRKDFHDYANLLFRTFGDRVKQWVTINEPLTIASMGFDLGSFPPNRCSPWMNKDSSGGDSATEPYIVSHNLLLAHADVVQLYRSQYQKKQKGIIGIVLSAVWPLPYNAKNPGDHNATSRFIDYSLGWYLSPITFGCYPQSMRDYVDDRLPQFTPDESKLVCGSIDFLGFNYYTAFYVYDINLPPSYPWPKSYNYDIRVGIQYTDVDGNHVGDKLGISWQYSYPKGIWDYLLYIKQHYNDPIIYITENGASEINNPNIPLEVSLKDYFRVKFYLKHLSFVKKAIDDGVKVKGYFGWALTDNFEWLEGYTVRFGIIYIDYITFKRYPKLSAQWFKRFLRK